MARLTYISQAPGGTDPAGRKLGCPLCQRGRALCRPPSPLSGLAWGRSLWDGLAQARKIWGEVGFPCFPGAAPPRKSPVWGMGCGVQAGRLSDEGQGWGLVPWCSLAGHFSVHMCEERAD